MEWLIIVLGFFYQGQQKVQVQYTLNVHLRQGVFKMVAHYLSNLKYCRSTNVRALLMFADFAIWQKTRTLIAREHFLQLLYPIYWLPKSQTLITGEMFWFAKVQTFIAANISWSTVTKYPFFQNIMNVSSKMYRIYSNAKESLGYYYCIPSTVYTLLRWENSKIICTAT